MKQNLIPFRHVFSQFTILISFVDIKFLSKKVAHCFISILVNLVSIQSSLWFTVTSLFFLYQFLFLSHTFFLLGGSAKFRFSTKVSSFSVAMVFLIFFIIDSMCTCKKITSVRRVLLETFT